MTTDQTQSIPMNKPEAIKNIGTQTRRKQVMLLEEFNNVWKLTKDEPDFPRKLLKYYNIYNIDTDNKKLTETDILRLVAKHFAVRPKIKHEM